MTPRNRRLAPPPPSAPPPAATKPRGWVEEARPARPPSQLLAVTRTILGGLLVLCLSTVVAWGARRHVLTSPRFAVEEIAVEGAHLRSAEILATESGITRGMNVFAIDLDRARAKLLADPWIETATLARQLPGKVVIQVSERELGAVVALPEPYLASRDGRIFKRLEPSDPSDLPILTGITADALAQDREGSQRIVVRALDVAGDYDHGPLAARAPLQEIHVSNGGELTLVVGNEGISLALGLPPFHRKLEEAGRILAELDRRGVHASVVMLDDEVRPDRVVVRTR